MKKNIYLSVALTFLTISFNSCDEIKEGDYYKDYVPTNSSKKILVEDWTGHKCGYCPPAAVEIDSLKKKFGDKIIQNSFASNDIF